MQELRKQKLANISRGVKSRAPDKIEGPEPVNIALMKNPPEIPISGSGASATNKTGGEPPRTRSSTEGGGFGGNIMPNPNESSVPSSQGTGLGTETRSRRTIRTNPQTVCQKELRNDPRFEATLDQMIVPPVANEGNEQISVSQSPSKRARKTDKRSLEAKRLRDEEDRVKFAGKTASEKAAILVLTAEKVIIPPYKFLKNNLEIIFLRLLFRICRC